MDSASYLRMVRQQAPETGPVIADPLLEARRFIDQHGKTGEGRALLAVIRALWLKDGEFRESDVWALGSEQLWLASVLVEARLQGRYHEFEWHRAASHPPWRFLLDLHKSLKE